MWIDPPKQEALTRVSSVLGELSAVSGALTLAKANVAVVGLEVPACGSSRILLAGDDVVDVRASDAEATCRLCDVASALREGLVEERPLKLSCHCVPALCLDEI